MELVNMMGPLMGVGIAVILLIVLFFYVYYALAFMTIAKKLNYKYPWFSWVPFLNIVQILEMGNFHWAWVFLILLPILGWLALWVMSLIAMWRIFEKRNYPGWLSLLQIGAVIPYIGFLFSIGFLIAVGMAAWKDK